MPSDIETLFADLGMSLLPRRGELSLDCSCPDWEVPCKHLAAAFHLLAERFDEDPFDVLAWRGRDCEDLLSRLYAFSSADAQDTVVPLTALLADFWAVPGSAASNAGTGGTEGSPVLGRGHAGADTVTTSRLSDQFPPIAMTVRNRPLAETLAPAYDALIQGTGAAEAP